MDNSRSKKILFICNTSLENPIRGTPLRIFNFLMQIKKRHNLFVSADNVSDPLRDCFIPYPKGGGRDKLQYFLAFIKKNNIEIILTATENGIKLPVFLKFFSGVKIAVDLHGLYGEELYFQGQIGAFKKFLQEVRIKFYLRFYDLIFTVSEKLADYYKGINPNTCVIYGGFNPDEFSYSFSFNGGEFIIGYAGNSRVYQGLDYLLLAAKNIKAKNLFKFRLNLIVSGERENLINKLKKFNLFEITELSFDINHGEVAGLIGKSTVLVIPRPSLKMTEYAYPSKLSEYLAMGIPLIITDVGPVKELFSNGHEAIVINAENIAENVESALVKIHKMKREELKHMSKSAAEFAKNNLSWDTLGLEINEKLSSL